MKNVKFCAESFLELITILFWMLSVVTLLWVWTCGAKLSNVTLEGVGDIKATIQDITRSRKRTTQLNVILKSPNGTKPWLMTIIRQIAKFPFLFREQFAGSKPNFRAQTALAIRRAAGGGSYSVIPPLFSSTGVTPVLVGCYTTLCTIPLYLRSSSNNSGQ